jgi:hypothetical protein
MAYLPLRVAALALTLSWTLESNAATVFNNGVPDLVSGTGMTEFRVADNFSLANATDISNIRFFSAQDTVSAYVGNITWAIFSNAAGQPGTSVTSGNTIAAATATGSSTSFGYGIYSLDLPVAFTLQAGNYWLSLHNGPLSNTTSAGDMTWATTGTGSGPTGRYLDASWIDTGNEHAFRLDGVVSNVPEPGAVALFLIGLVTLTGKRFIQQARR